MVWNNWIATCRIPKNLDTDLTPFTKISSKCILDLTVKYKTLKPLKDHIRENVGNLRFGKFSSPKTNQWIKKNWNSTKKKKNTRLLLGERQCQKNENTSDRLGENVCKRYLIENLHKICKML